VKAAIYLRVSTEEQTERYGLDMQRSRCRAYCEFREWEVVEIYEDAGITGSTLERPALQRMLLDGRDGKWDVVVVYKVDRLSRSVRNLLTICEDYLTPHQKDLASCNEGFDTKTPIGRFFLNMLGIFAEMERDTMRERMEGGRWEAARQGSWVSGGVPFGYRKVERPDKTRELVIEEAEAEIVRRMFDWHITEGIGCVAIAERLNSLGIATRGQTRNGKRQARLWTNSAVGRMLGNSLYMGEAYQHRRVGRKALDLHPKETWIPFAVPAIVSALTFEKSRKIAANNRRVSGGQNRTGLSYLLRDVLYCGHCGGRLRGMNSNCGAEKRRYYRCGRQVLKKRGEEGRCTLPYLPSVPLEELVWQQVREAIINPQNLERHAKLDPEDVAALRAEIALLDTRLAEIERQRERLRWLFTQGTINFEELEQDLCRLDQQRREVHAQQAGLAARVHQQEDLDARLHTLYELMSTLRSRIDLLDFEEKRLVLRDLGVRVTVNPDRSVQIDALILAPDDPEHTDLRTLAQTRAARTPPSGPW
jgi:site-specific DNA recombinase